MGIGATTTIRGPDAVRAHLADVATALTEVLAG